MAKDKKIAKDNGFFELGVIPGGPFDRFRQLNKVVKLPKESSEYLNDMIRTYGTDNVINMTEVPAGDYVFNKGILHAANVNVGRSLPWIEDGLKSVERRILYVMHTKEYYARKTTKVATVVGDMIAMVYPHGDQGAADAIFRIGRHRSMMIPYVQELSNYGNMKDLKPAAVRYADTALSQYAMDCFFGEVGPRAPLYDEKDNYTFQEKEPIFLTSRYPNILMQWNLGIGKGAMSWLGAFNSTDIFKATLKLMDDPGAKIEIYPDTPVPLEIINKADLKNCFDRKAFQVKVRSPYHVVTYQRISSKNGRPEDVHCVIFTALPLGVSGDQIVKEVTGIKLDDARSKGKSNRFPEITNIEAVVDEKNPGGIQIMVEYEHGYDPHALAEKLFRSTSLAKTISVKYNLIFDYKPELRTPREILLLWINQRYDQKRRYYHQMVLKAAKDRAIYEALATILGTKDATDKALSIIRSSNDDDESVAKLRRAFDFTDFQARVILNYRIKTLQKLNVKEMIMKRDQAVADYKHYRKLLASEDAIRDAVKDELREGMQKYGRERMAKLMNLSTKSIGEANDRKYVLYNDEYYYCFNDLEDLGSIGPKINNEYRLVEMKNGDSVWMFGRDGSIKVLNGYSFSPNDMGISMATLGMTRVASVQPESMWKDKDSMVLISARGYGKIMDLSEVTKSAKGKVISLSDDWLAGMVPVRAGHEEDMIVGMFRDDRMYYVRLDNFPLYKRSSTGNRIVKLKDGETINGLVVFNTTDDPDYLFLYGESGYAKLMGMELLSFAKKANNVVSLGKHIVGAELVHDHGELELYLPAAKPPVIGVSMEIGKMVELRLSTGESQKFRMSTSIGNPTKILRVNRSEWYAFSQ